MAEDDAGPAGPFTEGLRTLRGIVKVLRWPTVTLGREWEERFNAGGRDHGRPDPFTRDLRKSDRCDDRWQQTLGLSLEAAEEALDNFILDLPRLMEADR